MSKSFKILISGLLVILLLCGLCACGNNTESNTKTDDANITETTKTKDDIVDTSKLSAEELSQIALDNANAYLKEKYPDATFEYFDITPDEEYDDITKETKKNRFSFNGKTFEENKIHKKSYRVNYFDANGDPISVVTDVSLKNESGKNSCYDNYQLKKVMYEIFLKLENILEPGKTYSDNKKFEVDNYDRYNLSYFKTYFDESKGVLEFLRNSEEFKDKDTYKLNHFLEVSDKSILEKTFTDEEEEFLSYFNDIYSYTFKNLKNYDYPINSLTFDHKRILGQGTEFYTIFAPYLNGIDFICKYDTNNGKFVEQSHKIITEKNSLPICSYIATGGNTESYTAITTGNLSDYTTAITTEFTNAKNIKLVSDFYTAKNEYHYFISLKDVPSKQNQSEALIVIKNGECKIYELPEEPKFTTSNMINHDKVYVSPNDIVDSNLFFIITFER